MGEAKRLKWFVRIMMTNAVKNVWAAFLDINGFFPILRQNRAHYNGHITYTVIKDIESKISVASNIGKSKETVIPGAETSHFKDHYLSEMKNKTD